MKEKQELLSALPSVDHIIKSPAGLRWLQHFPRKYVIQSVREVIDLTRAKIIEGLSNQISEELLASEIEEHIKILSAYNLKPLINATGVVIHTNLGRSVLSEKIVNNIREISTRYSNLEYDLGQGKRGKRYLHIKRILRDITGAEDALVVNNNAAAVMLCLNTLAKEREVIVSRGELIEIGGSFRMPDVMTASGAVLREVGTTNKTHIADYEQAINEHTALILKVHTSNFRVQGFTEEVDIEDLVNLGKRYAIPVMFDLGSGCLVDLKPYGIPHEPVVKEFVKRGIDVTTFSGDKLLGGPQGGIIVGKKAFIEQMQKNPIARAVRIDKLTLAALEATLMEYVDEIRAIENIPTLKMLSQSPGELKKRAQRLAQKMKKCLVRGRIQVTADSSRAGGGALPEEDLPTYVISFNADDISVDDFQERLRKNSPPIITRIKENAVIFDVRTIQDQDVPLIIQGICRILSQ